MGGSITGHGADLIIIDDPIKSSDALPVDQLQKVNDWYTNSVPSRLNSIRDGAIIIVMQRLHEHDLVEYVQRNEDWKVVSLPAIAEKDESFTVRSIYRVDTLARSIGEPLQPERASREALQSLFYKIGRDNFYAQYQQAPLSSEGGDEDETGWPDVDEFEVVFQSWEMISDANHPCDRCAGSLWGIKGGTLYLLYLVQSPMEQDQAIHFIDKMAEGIAPQLILLEDRTPGQQYAAALRPQFDVQISAMNIRKAERIRIATRLLASDRVEIPWKASWLDPFRRPLLAFSENRDLDGEDSVSQARYWFQNHSQKVAKPSRRKSRSRPTSTRRRASLPS